MLLASNSIPADVYMVKLMVGAIDRCEFLLKFTDKPEIYVRVLQNHMRQGCHRLFAICREKTILIYILLDTAGMTLFFLPAGLMMKG